MDPRDAHLFAHREDDDDDAHLVQTPYPAAGTERRAPNTTLNDTRASYYSQARTGSASLASVPRYAADSSSHAVAAAGGSVEERIASVKASARHEKQVLLDRIAELAQELRVAERERQKHAARTAEYHRVFGSLDSFASRQAQLHEELVSLRDAVRLWQDKEAAARTEAREVRRTLDAVRRNGTHDSGESRLGDLEDRLALAHLQRAELIRERDDVERMATARSLHHELGAGVSSPGQTDWQLRGKRADVDGQLRRKDALIASLTAAAESLRTAMESERSDEVGAANRKCPGCQQPQWASPFCPSTGHEHLGYNKAGGDARRGASQPAAANRPGASGTNNVPGTPSLPRPQPSDVSDKPVFKPMDAEAMQRRVDDAIASGDWAKRVQVGSFDVTYRHKVTGETVADLGHHFDANDRADHEAAVRRWEAMALQRDAQKAVDSQGQGSKPDPATRGSTTGGSGAASSPMGKGVNVRPAMAKEVAALVERLKESTAENAQLRSLLARVAKTGVVGWKPPPGRDAAAADAAAAAPTPQRPPANVPLPGPADGGADGEGGVVSLHNEDDVMVLTKLQRVESECGALSARCTELILELSRRDERVAELQEMIKTHRMADAPPGSVEHGLRLELAGLRDKLVAEERRTAALEDELRRAKMVR